MSKIDLVRTNTTMFLWQGCQNFIFFDIFGIDGRQLVSFKRNKRFLFSLKGSLQNNILKQVNYLLRAPTLWPFTELSLLLLNFNTLCIRLQSQFLPLFRTQEPFHSICESISQAIIKESFVLLMVSVAEKLFETIIFGLYHGFDGGELWLFKYRFWESKYIAKR